MFYAKDFKSILEKVKEYDHDAEVVPSLHRINFNMPIIGNCRLEYVNQGFDDEGDAMGSIMLYYGDRRTEFDSLQYAIDGLEGLARMIAESDTITDEPEDDTLTIYTSMSTDALAGDLVSYLYDNYNDASYIGEKELNDGSIALRIDWGKSDRKAIAHDLKDRYGDRISFINTRSEYAPELDSSGILVNPPKAAQAVTESIINDKFELVENFPVWAIEPLVNDSWGDYLQYNGEELAREDFSDIDNFMTTHGYCGIHAPSDELYDHTHSDFTSRPAFGKATDTCSVYAVKGPWKSLMKEYGLKTAAPVTEATDGQPKELTEDNVQQTIDSLGLQIINKWYDGNKSRPVFDCQKDNGETICVWTEPPYEAKVWLKDREPGNNRFTEDIITLDSLESELNALLDEMHEEELNAATEKISAPDYHAEGAYEDLTDLGNDFESVQSAPRLESINADAVSYEVVVADLNVKSRVSVKIISEDTALLNTIFNYFISVSSRPSQIYHLADNPNIYLDGMWRHYYEDYQTPYLYTSVNVQTPNNLRPNPALHLGLDDVHIEKLKESRLQSIVLDNVKRFVNQAIDYGAAHPEKNLSVVNIPNPHMEIAEDDPRAFAYDESVELYKDIKAVCDIAGKPALAEAVIKLHKAYHHNEMM